MFERLYRTLLLLYPREFRRDYGEAMAQAFRDRMRREGGGARSIAVFARTLADLAPSAFREHRERAAREGLTVMRAALGSAAFLLRSVIRGAVLYLAAVAFALLVGLGALTTGWYSFNVASGPLRFLGYTMSTGDGGNFWLHMEFSLPAAVMFYGVAALWNELGSAARARKRRGGASAWPEV